MTASTATVLVVEDDGAIRRAVADGLRAHGFDVVTAPTGEEALAALAGDEPIDLVVLDVGLPGMSGVEMCARLRGRGDDIPVLVLSARDDVGDRIAGLEAGADDYLVKPFDLGELVARLTALRRRSTLAHRQGSEHVVTVGDTRVDLAGRVADVAGVRLDLTRREFDLLAALVGNRDVVLARTRLLELVWGYDFDTDTNVVDVFVGYLRKKLAAAGATCTIDTVRGVGFVVRAG